MLWQDRRPRSDSVSLMTMMEDGNPLVPVVLASPAPATCRSHPGHQSTQRVSLPSVGHINVDRTFARASASGMSLSASFVKSFSGFSRPPSDMMTDVREVG